eukprot:6928814-Ditylum_brightwellii.AAC.1
MKYQAVNLPTKPEKFEISGCSPDKLAILVETVHACLGDRFGCSALVAVQTKPVLLARQLARDGSYQTPTADQTINLWKE